MVVASIEQWSYPQRKRKANKPFSCRQRRISLSSGKQTKMVPTDPLCLVAFFEQCQTADKVAGVLDKLKEPNAKPVHLRPYPVPQINLKTFKTELNHLVRIGVLAPQQK
jgi:hypothetical protein